MSLLLVMARSVEHASRPRQTRRLVSRSVPGTLSRGRDWPHGRHNMDHFLFDDNIPQSEDIIAAYATIWTVSIALQPLWKSLSAAVSPRPRAGSHARRPPLPAQWASSKRGSGYDFST